jgi:hypothetical protein
MGPEPVGYAGLASYDRHRPNAVVGLQALSQSDTAGPVDRHYSNFSGVSSGTATMWSSMELDRRCGQSRRELGSSTTCGG